MCVRSVPANGCQTIFSYESIHRNYLKCRSNKRNSPNALKFEIKAEENILKLEQQLNNKTYHPSRCILFTAQKPKVREIFASPFHDRVVHHILIEQLAKIWEPMFIHDSYSCRNGKGTHKAVVRLQGYLRQITKNGNLRAYYLQLDIKDFFISINKEILFGLVKAKVKDPDVLWLCEKTIFWDCTKDYLQCGDPQMHEQIPSNKTLFGKNNERGLPIGNLTSQFFANIYMNELDQYIKHMLKAKFYLRYVDDFVILSKDPDELVAFKEKIKQFLSDKLSLQLHPKRQKLMPASSGIDFLGYIVRQNYILVRRRVINNLRSKLQDFESSKEVDLDQLQSTTSSYLGHFKWGNTYRLKNRIKNRIEKISAIHSH